MGFCVPYIGITKFKQQVAANQNMEDVIKYVSSHETFTQWVADVHNNLGALDGTGTFHGMGIIAISRVQQKCLLLFQK